MASQNSNLTISCNHICAGIRSFNQINASWSNILILKAATPNPANTIGSPTGAFNFLSSPSVNAFNSKADNIELDAPDNDGSVLTEGYGSKVIGTKIVVFNAGRNGITIGDNTTLFGCESQNSGNTDFLLKGGELIGCGNLGQIGGGAHNVFQLECGASHLISVIGGEYWGNSHVGQTDASSSIILAQAGLSAIFSGVQFQTGLHTSFLVNLYHGAGGEILIDSSTLGLQDGPLTNATMSANSTGIVWIANSPDMSPPVTTNFWTLANNFISDNNPYGVGIGSSSPDSFVSIVGQLGRAFLHVGTDQNIGGDKVLIENGWGATGAAGLKVQRNNSTPQFIVDGTGNVGIATSTPGSPLSVNGLIYSSSGGVKFPDGTIQTTASTLSAPVSLANGGTATSTFYSGGVIFSDGSKLTQSSANSNFFWDNTNRRLGLGTASPAALLDVANSQALFRMGSASDGSGAFSYQIRFGFAGADQYQQFLRTRHNGGSGTDNAFDFYTSDGTQAGVFPTNAILGLTVTNGKASVNNLHPTYNLDVTGNGHFTTYVDARNFVATSTSISNVFMGSTGIGTSSPATILVTQGPAQFVIASGVATSTCTTAIEGSQVYNLGNHHLWLCMGSEPWTLVK